MFDTYYESPRCISTTVHEHRAPTDESVKLLKEMEQKIEEKILAVFQTDKDNFLQGSVVHKVINPMIAATELIILYILNGEKFEHRIKVDEIGFRLDKDRAMRELAQAISNTVTMKILSKVGL